MANSFNQEEISRIESIFNGNTFVYNENYDNITEIFIENFYEDYNNGNYTNIINDLSEKTTITLSYKSNINNTISPFQLVPNDPGDGTDCRNVAHLKIVNANFFAEIQFYVYGTYSDTGEFYFYCNKIKSKTISLNSVVEYGIDYSYPNSVTLNTTSNPDKVTYTGFPYLKLSNGGYIYLGELTIILYARGNNQPQPTLV